MCEKMGEEHYLRKSVCVPVCICVCVCVLGGRGCVVPGYRRNKFSCLHFVFYFNFCISCLHFDSEIPVEVSQVDTTDKRTTYSLELIRICCYC